MTRLEEKLLNEFSQMFPEYELQSLDHEGYKLIRKDAITTEDGTEGVWLATIFEVAELFRFLEYNRQIVNERERKLK